MSKIYDSVKNFITNHKVSFIWVSLYIVTVIVGLFYSPWESEMMEGLVASGSSIPGKPETNLAVVLFPGSYDLLSFFFYYFVERGSGIMIVIIGLLVLSAENIIEKIISKKYTSDVKFIEKLIISFFSSNVIFSVTSYLFALLSPLIEALPDMSNSIILRIIAVLILILFVPVAVDIVLCLGAFMLPVIVSAFLSINHIPVFLIFIAVFVVAVLGEFIASKISDLIGRVVWSIIPFLRPLADLLK